jgi:hypothetical protein
MGIHNNRHECPVQVLHYTVPHQPLAASGISSANATAPDSSRFLQVVDDALPQELLQHLQQAFAPSAPFWSEHSYGRVGYFSYFFALVRRPLQDRGCPVWHNSLLCARAVQCQGSAVPGQCSASCCRVPGAATGSLHCLLVASLVTASGQQRLQCAPMWCLCGSLLTNICMHF